MRKMLSILRYEYKMQISRIATWGVLLVATVANLLDNFPSMSNLARLEFLVIPHYFVYRTMSLCGLILIFGLMFLLSNRLSVDEKSGVKSLIMASPVRKSQYVAGKLLGSFLYTTTITMLFLMLNAIVYAIFSPVKVSIAEYIILLAKAEVVSIIPVSFFISFCSIALSGVLDIRLFYFTLSAVFILNATTVSSAQKMPFYAITSGDLMKLIWQHPKFPFNNIGSMMINLCFLIGCGFLFAFLLLCKHKFWRAE